MKLKFDVATEEHAAELAALHAAVAAELTRKFGKGRWSFAPDEKGLRRDMQRPKFSKVVVARSGRRIIGALRLATKKPWAIDTAYFTPVRTPLYLTAMAVHPAGQHSGVGRALMEEAQRMARAWPADAIRLDAFDAAAGAADFYAKCGYRETGRVKYKGDPLVYFELVLSPGT